MAVVDVGINKSFLRLCVCVCVRVCPSLHLFDGEVVDQVVVVFVQAAVQRDAVGVEEQVLKRKKERKT